MSKHNRTTRAIARNNYQPYKFGLRGVTGRDPKASCPTCGVQGPHSLAQGGKCDWLKRPKAERERILAAKAAKEAA